MTPSGFHPLVVSEVERLCDDAVAIRFSVPDDLRAEYAFSAGQHLTLRRIVDGVDERRSYSVCAPVGAAPRVGVREIPGGLFSTWLVRDLHPGDVVDVGSPTGRFTLDTAKVEPGGRHLLIGAGSGITPLLSLATTLLEQDAATRVSLVYGNRSTTTVMFAEEVADLKDRFPARIEVVHVLSREPRNVDLLSGRLDGRRLEGILTGLVPVAGVDHAWLCGPFGMVGDARVVLELLGVPADRVHTELFYIDEPPPGVVRSAAADAPPTAAGTCRVTITVDGRTQVVDLPRDVPLLDAAARTRGDLPFACKGGVCGTCRTKVLRGEVSMRRNFALGPDEVAAGFVLACQSLPTTDELVVDFDA